MAFTTADLDAIDRAIASGELLVRIDGDEIRFQSADDLLKRRRIIQQALSAGTFPSRTVPRYQLANFSDDGTE